jgi:hypothetical protein
MGRPPLSVGTAARLEIRIEDGLQDERQRTLDHPVPDSGNTEHADFRAPVLRYLLPPVPQRKILMRHQFVPDLLLSSQVLQTDRRLCHPPLSPLLPKEYLQ